MKRRILIIEDETDIRELLTSILENFDFEVSSATNGKEAMEHLQANPVPCLILLDNLMPEMTGLDFRRLQLESERLKNIPVVLMSAGRSPATLTDDRTLKFVNKPIDLYALIDLVKALLQKAG